MNDDRISELYKGEIWGDAVQQRARRRVHWLCSEAVGDTVLDIGCSQGIASIILGREGFTVTGIDIQPSRIDYAVADLENEPEDVRSRVQFLVGNGVHIDVDDDSIDTVLLGEVIEHLSVPERLLEEIRRVLKPGGRVVITTPFGLSPNHDHKQTFYPAGVLSMIASVLSPVEIDIVDRYFRIVAEKHGHGRAPSMPDPSLTLVVLDGVFAEFDRERAATYREDRTLRETVKATKQDYVEAEKERVDERNRRAAAERGIVQLKSDSAAASATYREELAASQTQLDDEKSITREVEETLTAALLRAKKADVELRVRSKREVAFRKRIAHLERDRWKLRNRLAISQWKLRSFLQRKWWRMGVAIGKIRSNPFRIFILPFDLVSIAFSKSVLPPRPGALTEPTRYSAPTAKPDPPATDQAKPTEKKESPRTKEAFRVPSVQRPAAEPSRDLLVATLLDEFSFDLFEHEFRSVQVTPEGWGDVLAQEPSMLLVESAWRGKDDLWLGQMAREQGPSDTFKAMVKAFAEGGVPTVFWNKEDPPNYHLYIEAAKLFDVVFTVCEEAIPDYVRDLGHERVFLLPFSVQPKIHNPVAVGKRSNGVAFAGTYYAKKHPEREAQVEAVLDPAREFPFSIFARVASSGNYKWPDRFERFIVGSLPYQDVLTAYKMFDVFLNVNSVVDSESMCARRIFELAASGTPILSGTSPAIERFFGDTVLQAADDEAGRVGLRVLLGSSEMRARIAQRGIRTSMREHTASLRFDEILERSGVAAPRTPPSASVSLVVPTNRPLQMDEILENVGRQSYSNLQLVVAAHGLELDEADLKKQGADLGVDNIVVTRVDSDRTLGEVINAGFDAADGAYIGKIDDDNYYGAEFVGDLMDAFGYTNAGIVGKWTHYTYVEGLDAMVLRFPGFEHTYVELVAGSAMIVERTVFDAVKFPSERVGEDTQFLRDAKKLGVRTYSGDRYNYVYMRYSDPGHHTFDVSDIELAAKGELVQYGLNIAHVTV
jgi:SAM-dependent methyltransferase